MTKSTTKTIPKRKIHIMSNSPFKARLHLQLLLRFLVRFSPFDGCDTNVQTRMFRHECSAEGYMYPEHPLLIHSFTSVKRRKSHWKSQQKLQV